MRKVVNACEERLKKLRKFPDSSPILLLQAFGKIAKGNRIKSAIKYEISRK